MLLRAVADDLAPNFASPARARHADRRLRFRLSVGDPRRLLGDRHRCRPGPALDQRHELVPPCRAPLRRVRLVVGGDARLRPVQNPLRHRLQHEHGPSLARGGNGVRAPWRRRGADGGDAVPDLSRPPAPRAQPRGAAAPGRGGGEVPPRGLGTGRAVLRRAVRKPEGSLQAHSGAARNAGHLLGLRRPRAGARGPLRLPALLAPRQRPPHAHLRGRGDARLDLPRGPQPRRDRRRGRRNRRLPRRPRGDPDGRSRPDRRRDGAAAGGGAGRGLAGAGAERRAALLGGARRQPDGAGGGDLPAG